MFPVARVAFFPPRSGCDLVYEDPCALEPLAQILGDTQPLF